MNQILPLKLNIYLNAQKNLKGKLVPVQSQLFGVEVRGLTWGQEFSGYELDF